MRFYSVFSVMFLLCGLVVLGCGDHLEESDADVLEPDEIFRFQELPLVEGGSLIPPEEIPVVTIEKTREDAENIWWRLKTNPAPSREDLVVAVNFPDLTLNSRDSNFDLEELHKIGVGWFGRLLVSIPTFENSSIEMKSPRLHVDWALEVSHFTHLISNVATRQFAPAPLALDKLPSHAFVLNDGYVVPQGFEFPYYLPGTTSSLEIPAMEEAQ